MKIFVLALVFAAVFAAEKEEDRPKTFKRLIPADVLRGKSRFVVEITVSCN